MAYTIDDELRPQRAYSPGVVQDEEELLRIIEYPLKPDFDSSKYI